MTILLENVKIIYPSIYTKRDTPFSDKEAYRSAIQYGGDLLTNEGVIPRGKENLYNAASGISSILMPKSKDASDFYQISEYINLARNCNFNLDSLFKGMTVDMTVSIWNYSYQDREGMGFAINEIHLNPDDLITTIEQRLSGEVKS